MTKTSRIFCILQLCIGFSLLLFSLSYPSLGSLYADKKKILIVESALGDSSGEAWKLANPQEKAVLERNRAYAERLDLETKGKLEAIKTSIAEQIEERSLVQATISYFFQNPYFSLYILFSILIPIMLLLGKERSLSLLLPLIAACFAFDNAVFAPDKAQTAEDRLFPTETELRAAYPSASLQEAFDAYLMKRYGQDDLGVAQHGFLTARALAQNPSEATLNEEKKNKSALVLFFMWNVFFVLNMIPRKNSLSSL